MELAIRKVISEFDSRPMQSARSMRALLEQNPAGFFELALSLVRTEPDSAGYNYLLTLLLSQGLLLKALCDPETFTLEEATRIGQRLLHVDATFDVRLVRSLIPQNGNTSPKQLEHIAGTATGIRLLEILSEISDGTRILSTMAQLLGHPNSRIRSKAALLVGRSNKNHKWVEERLAENDPRVRANAVESLWGSDTPGCRALFWTALGDHDNRVVGNAALGLYRLGDPDSVKVVLQLLSHSDPGFRCSGVWVMGESGDPRFIPILAKVISEPVTELRGNALRAMAKLKKAMTKRSSGAPLDVYACNARLAPDDWVEFVAAIGCGRGLQLPDLNATNFAIWQDSDLVREYTVRQRGKNEPIAIALALPRIVNRISRAQGIQETAVELALKYKRRSDLWMVLKYISGEAAHKTAPTTAEPPAGVPMSPGDEDLSSVRMRFTSDPDAITDAASALGTRLETAADPLQAARSLTEAAGQVRAARNIIFIFQSEMDTFPAGFDDVVRAAQASNIAVHAVSSWPNEGLTQLCAQTGGMLVTTSFPEEIPEALEAICSSLMFSYEIRFKPEHAGPSKIRLQVHTDGLIGEGHQTLG